MMKTAVILAADLDSSLKEHTRLKPKGLLKIDGVTIIEQSIQKLISHGIENIIIGTGYLNHSYDKLMEYYPNLRCVFTPETSIGSMGTLYAVKDYLNQSFLLLESDLIYEKVAISILKDHPYTDVVLGSSITDYGNEVFIETKGSIYIANISKQKEYLNSVDLVLVGLSKISCSTLKSMCDSYEAKQDKLLDYRIAMAETAAKINLLTCSIPDLAWCGVENKNQLTRAVEKVYPAIKAKEFVPSIKRNVLLNPGPATTTDTVKFAQVIPDICHREEEFCNVVKYIARELALFVSSSGEYETILLGGSGTAAVESMISSVVPDKGGILIINNGAYGKRMIQIAETYKLNYLEFVSPITEPICPKELEKTILNSPILLTHLAIVHHETTTGLLNDLSDISEICRAHNLFLLVDAMSSYGAVPIDMDKTSIHFLAASSNKNLQGMAGVSFVITKPSFIEQATTIPARNFYLNLGEQYKSLKNDGQFRFTPPVQTLYALRQAIIETKLEGIVNRYKRYQRNWEVLIKGLEKLGLTYLVDSAHHGKLITSVYEPETYNFSFQELHNILYFQGITIYPGKIGKQKTFRVATIGQIYEYDVNAFLTILEEYINGSYYIKNIS